MKKPGFAKVSIGLIVGVSLGLAILALKTYVAEQIVALLEDEVVASCDGCHFAADSVTMSLLTFSATASRPRIEQHGKTVLEFKRIHASASLGQIGKRKIILSQVDLFDGTAFGVSPDSATFKFIDHLTEPLPPEKDRPGRWRAILHNLRVINSRFIESFTRSDLVAEGISLTVERDERDNFWLRPKINELKVVSTATPSSSPFKIGTLTTQIYLGDDKASFQDIKLKLAKALIQGSAVSHNNEDNRLEGNLALDIDSESYGMPRWLRFNVQGQAELSGTLGRPDVKGTIKEAGAPLELLTGGKPRVSFDTVNGDFKVKVRKGESEAALHQLDAQSASSSLKIQSPLGIRNDTVFGKLTYQAEEIQFEDVTLHNVRGEVDLSEKDYDVKVTATAHAAAAVSHGFSFRDMDIRLIYRNDELETEFSHQSPELGSLSARGKVKMDEEPARILNLDFQYSDYALFQPDWPSTQVDSPLHNLRFTGAGTIKGPLRVATIEGSSSYTLSSTSLETKSTFQGDAQLHAGILETDLADKGNSLSMTLTFPFVGNAKSHLSLAANNLRPEDLFPDLECLDFSGSAEYDFEPELPWGGTGEFKISGLQFGCAPYTVSLEQARTLRITAGNATLPASAFRGLDSSVLLQGDISAAQGFNLNAQGQLELNSLVALLPAVDDLSGNVIAALDLKGPIAAPKLTGKASIRKGEFAIESTNVSASDISGDVTLRDSTINIENLTSTINGGTAQLRGTLLPLTPEKSTLTLSASGITIDPFPNTILQLGGDVEMKELPNGVPSIEGTILVEGGEFQHNLEVANLIRAFSDYVFARSPQVQQTRLLPRVDLNIGVVASRNLFMYTNWAGAEFKGDLIISGDLNAPVINGAIETISGWFGIRDRRFEITSGTLAFKAGAPQPILEIIGETYVPSYTGDTILVIAEARGPLTNPKITFASDRGLSEREILNLLAIGANRGGQTLANTAARDLEMQSDPLFDETSILNFPRFLSNLTRINSLSLQPTYNVQTGLIEPAIVAEKKLTDYLSLVGESTFGGPATESRLKLLYDLTPYMKLAGIAESVSTREKSALGVDLTYTVLAKQREFVKIVFVGNKNLDRLKILKGIRLNSNSRVSQDDLPRLQEATREFYRTQGYLEAEVAASCNSSDQFCRDIVFATNEGKLYYVSSISLEGDNIDSALDTKSLLKVSKNLLATEEELAKRRDDLIKRLRGEGYISARVTGRYEFSPNTGEAVLLLNVKAGKPVSFVFEGNHEFSAEDFLDTINLFNRKQPFGNNTINILLQNMERKYREAGYLYATLSFSKVEDVQEGRITYLVSVHEDSPTEVEQVTFSGNHSLSNAELERLVSERNIVEQERIFYPTYAVAEEIEQNISTLIDVYTEEGFPNTKITYQLVPLSEPDKIEIQYIVKEGGVIRADKLSIEGLPEIIPIPQAPPAPYSIPKANRYIDELLDILKDRGFLKPTLWSEIAQETSEQMTIHVDAGSRTFIRDIIIEGNVGISEKIMRRNLVVKAGDPWDTDAINESKRKLLRLGLSSRVEMSPRDGALDSENEDLVVRVSERPLTTLEVGGGINSEFGFHVFGEAVDRDLFRDGRTLSLRVDLYYDPAQRDISQGVAGFRYSDPYFLASNFSLAEELRFEKLDLSTLEYNLDRISLASYIYRSWDSGLSTSFGHTILSDNVTDVPQDAILSDLDSGYVKLSFLSAVIGYDQRDNPLNPLKGYNLNFDMRIANEGLLSDANYYAMGGRASYLAQVTGTRFSFAFNTRAASAWTYAGTTEMPITQRYYLGGRNSVRGFRENSLGPRGSEDSVLGGDSLLSGSSEARYLLQENLSVHLFLDGGNVFLRGDASTSYSLRYSTGVGMRFLSPIGPIGFDIGHPLERRGDDPAVRFHFNIGTNF